MWLFDLLQRRRNGDLLSRMAAKVAHDSHKAVWQRVSHRVLAMRLNEARGYVRARAAHCIQSQVEAMARRHPQMTDKMRHELVVRATDHVVGLVIRDVLVSPAPAPARLRAA